MTPEQQSYYDELRRKQEAHLSRIVPFGQSFQPAWRPCMHEQCPSCVGTGITSTGSPCVHMISCPCPRCTPSYSMMVTP